MRFSRPVLLIVMTIALGVTAPTLGQVINEDLKLLASDGAAGDEFGLPVTIDDGVIAVGSKGDSDNGSYSGSAYLFDASTGAQLAKLLPTDGAADDWFGLSVAVSGNLVVIGAYADDDNGTSSGSAYIFNLTSGEQLLKLLPADGAAADFFGISVAINGSIAVVGSYHDDDNGRNSGSAYVFDVRTGQQLFKLLAADGSANDTLGDSIAVSGNLVVIGAHWDDDNGDNSGSAYLFDASTGTQVAKLLPSDGAADDYFGSSVAIENGIIAVGTNGDDDNGHYSGSAYLFDVGSSMDCLNLTVENLLAGERATFVLSGGTPGAKAATVYSLKEGRTAVSDFAGYCATFGININQSKVIGGLNRRFDTNGEINFKLRIPGGASGLHLFFQSAEHDTCPDDCMSNLVEMVVE